MNDRPPRLVSWHDESNATRYRQHAGAHRMYVETSRRLVELSDLEPGVFVMDLACGSGVTTQAIVDRLGSAVRVLAVDFSRAQLAQARRAVDAANVRFLEAAAERVGDVLRATDPEMGPVDAVLCNSAFWQVRLEETLRQLRSIGRIGTRLVFNMPARDFPTSTSNLSDGESGVSELMELHARMLEIAGREFGYKPPAPRRRDPYADEKTFLAAFPGSGYRIVRIDSSVTTKTPEEVLDWYRVPIFGENVLPGLEPAKTAVVIEEAAASWRPSCRSFPVAWADFVTEMTAIERGAGTNG